MDRAPCGLDEPARVNEKTGEERYSVVKQTFIRQADNIYQLTYEDGTLIETTWSHPFYIRGKGWVKAEDLVEGDVSQTEGNGSLKITKVHVDVRGEEVYNFEVEEDHNYYVSQAGVLVHNESYDSDVAIQALEQKIINSNGGMDPKDVAPFISVLCGKHASMTCLKTLKNILKTEQARRDIDRMKDAEPVQVLIRNTIDEMEQEATFRFKNERESLKAVIERRKAFLENHDVQGLKKRREFYKALNKMSVGSSETFELSSEEYAILREARRLERDLQRYDDLYSNYKVFRDTLTLAKDKGNALVALSFMRDAQAIYTRQKYRGRNFREIEALAQLRQEDFIYDTMKTAEQRGDPKSRILADPNVHSNYVDRTTLRPEMKLFIDSLPAESQHDMKVWMKNGATPQKIRLLIHLRSYQYHRQEPGSRFPSCIKYGPVPFNERLNENMSESYGDCN